jgi:16S rRNA (guanine527-N7)-methyltransferase
MPAYGPEEFQRDTGVSRETLARLAAYAALLEKWSRAVNLVGRATLPELWRRHMLDSAQLAELLPPAPADRPRRIADLGSGAGFPGLVLAILDAGEVHLVESDARKAAFLREAARAADARPVLHVKRIEALAPLGADVVTARALAPLPALLGYAARHLAPGGVALFPKGRDAERELTDARKAWNMTVESVPSRSDHAGTLLRIEGLTS